MSVTVYVPGEATARSLGADADAQALQQQAALHQQSIRLVRNGSRGLFWLEPLVEVQTAAGRVLYGPVQAADVPGLFAAGALQGGAHRLRLGAPESIPYLHKQERLTCGRLGVDDRITVYGQEATGRDRYRSSFRKRRSYLSCISCLLVRGGIVSCNRA